MVRFRYDRSQRITRRADYQSIYSNGKRAGTDLLRVYAVTVESPAKPRLGISLERKIGKANIRNQIKRRLREIFRLHQYEIKPGSQIVIVAKSGCNNLAYAELEKIVLKLFLKLKLLITMEETNGR